MITVPDGASALEELSRVPADLVLLDVMMPHLNGLEVCERIKANPDTYLIPVVLVTALSDRQNRIEGIRAGADDFLSRPVGRTELLARVRSLLKLKQRTDELERAESVLFTLARSIEGKDPYTHGHCERLAEYSARLGEHMGLADDQITALRRAGVGLHLEQSQMSLILAPRQRQALDGVTSVIFTQPYYPIQSKVRT